MKSRAADATALPDQATISFHFDRALWLRYCWSAPLRHIGIFVMALVLGIALAAESRLTLILVVPWWFLVGRRMWYLVRILCGADVQFVLLLPSETAEHKCVGVSTDGGRWITPLDDPVLRDVGRAILLDGAHVRVVIPVDQLSAADRALLERSVGSKPQ